MCRHWKEIYSDFLSVENHPEEAIITAIEEITVKNPRTFKEERVLAMYLKGEAKPLILCATNCRDLERIAKSGKPSDWVGLEILLKPVDMELFGELKPVLRFKSKNERKPAK